MRSNVDLPHPLGPTIATNSPAAIVQVERARSPRPWSLPGRCARDASIESDAPPFTSATNSFVYAVVDVDWLFERPASTRNVSNVAQVVCVLGAERLTVRCELGCVVVGGGPDELLVHLGHGFQHQLGGAVGIVDRELVAARGDVHEGPHEVGPILDHLLAGDEERRVPVRDAVEVVVELDQVDVGVLDLASRAAHPSREDPHDVEAVRLEAGEVVDVADFDVLHARGIDAAALGQPVDQLGLERTVVAAVQSCPRGRPAP